MDYSSSSIHLPAGLLDFLPGHIFIEDSEYLCISGVPGYNALYIRSFIKFNEGVKRIY